jgi:N6-adenosine-specific RNA methylase IME4
MSERLPIASIEYDGQPDSDNVAFLMESMGEPGIGQIMPIGVVKKGNGYRVIEGMGRDRVEAASRLGWSEVDAVVRASDSKKDRLLVELCSIDEALCRKKLSPALEARLTWRRKELYLLLHPDTRRGVAGGKARQGATTADSAFAESQAKASGRSRRSVEVAARRGQLGADLDRVRGTSLDKGEELDALVALPEDRREALIERAVAGEKVKATTALKQHQRELREIELAGRQQDLPSERFGVLYIDPPWKFAVYSQETGMDRAADNHYPTLPDEEIIEFFGAKVSEVAADDAVMFLCATGPHLRTAMRAITAAGFEYKAECVWVKDVAGTGYWFRQQHETLLVATRGSVPAPAAGEQWSSVIDARRGRHSEKPASFYELIESYFPHLSKIELFARTARDGWSCWGQEAPTDDPVAETIDGDGAMYEDQGEHRDGEPESDAASSEDGLSSRAGRERPAGAALENGLAATAAPSDSDDPGDAEGGDDSEDRRAESADERRRGRGGRSQGGTGAGDAPAGEGAGWLDGPADAQAPVQAAVDDDPFDSLTVLRKAQPNLPDVDLDRIRRMAALELPAGFDRRGI